jgi:hypothetical protein
MPRSSALPTPPTNKTKRYYVAGDEVWYCREGSKLTDGFVLFERCSSDLLRVRMEGGHDSFEHIQHYLANSKNIWLRCNSKYINNQMKVEDNETKDLWDVPVERIRLR